MANPNITVVKKIYNAILKSKIKHLTCDSLSYELGIYPDVIAENLSYFDPLIIMDFDYDLRTLRTTLEKFISDKEEKKEKREERKQKLDRKLNGYEGIADFIYQKFTVGGGIVDRNARISTADLQILKALVVDELAARKPKKIRKK
jgi:hypothetical protein